MSPGPVREGVLRLALPWRRALVLTMSCSALLLTALQLSTRPGGEVRPALSLLAASLILGSLWLLADSIWPWVGGDLVDPEERAHADYALRRAYSWLFVIALAGLVYLQLSESQPALRPEVPHQVSALLWSLIGLVVLLPVGLYAWEDHDEHGAPELAPLGLLRARLTGPSAALHRAALGTLAASLPLLLMGPEVGPRAGVPANAALVLALGALAIAAWTGVRAMLSDRTPRTDGPRS